MSCVHLRSPRGRRSGPARAFHAPADGYVDGFRADEDGNIWASAGCGVDCVGPDGTLLGRLAVPETVSNLAFGGRAGSRLFVCATSSVYALYLNRRGARAR